MFDTDKFIQFVQENPSIWEKSSKDYSDRALREKSWVMIGEKLYEKWPDMSEKEKQIQVKEMKNKWRHIRDSFTKYINQGKSGDPATKKKKYVYADALMFLLQTLEKRHTSGNITGEEDDSQLSCQDEDETQASEDSENTQEEALQKVVSIPFKKPSTKKSDNMSSFQKQLLHKLCSERKETEDADKSYLLSLLPDYKRLNDDQKLDFRIYTLQFFRDIRRTSSLTPNPAVFHSSSSRDFPPRFPHYQHVYNMNTSVNVGYPENLQSYNVHPQRTESYNTRNSNVPVPSPYPSPQSLSSGSSIPTTNGFDNIPEQY